MVARFVGAVGRVGSACAVVVTLGGCPGGAVLEEPERFPQYAAGATSVGAGGGAGTGGMAGTGATAGTSGAAGAGGTAGSGGVPLSCDIVAAMKSNCARTGCHNAAEHWAGLDFSNLDAIGSLLVDKPALHGDIDCAPVPPFRACTPEEATALGCPSVKLVDSKNFEASWVVTKINGQQANCGREMPAPPGNSSSTGWGDARRACFLEYFRSLIPAPAP